MSSVPSPCATLTVADEPPPPAISSDKREAFDSALSQHFAGHEAFILGKAEASATADAAVAGPTCWNPADCHPGITLSDNNTRLTYSSDARTRDGRGNMLVRGNVGVTRGVHSWETTITKHDSGGSGYNIWGVATKKADVAAKKPPHNAGPGVWALVMRCHDRPPLKSIDGRQKISWDHGLGGCRFKDGTKIGVRLDMDACSLQFAVDGKYSNTIELPRGETYFPVMGMGCLTRTST